MSTRFWEQLLISKISAKIKSLVNFLELQGFPQFTAVLAGLAGFEPTNARVKVYRGMYYPVSPSVA